MRLSILLFFLFWVGAAHAAVEHIPIKSNVELKPDEAQTITVEATQPREIGWQAVQAKPCTTKCVQATDVTGSTVLPSSRGTWTS